MTDHIDTAAERAKLEDLAGHTPGPWAGVNMVHADHGGPMTPEEIAEYVCNCVKLGDPNRFLFVSGKHDDGGDADICHTGNGPRGPANTRLIAAAPDLLATVHRLLDALDAERALTQRATDGWSKVQDAQIDALDRAEKAEAELVRLEHDISIAENHIAKDAETYTEQHLEIERLRDAIKNAEAERDQALARLAAAYAAADICALTPADAEAALQRVVDATWDNAIEAAARAQEVAYRRGVLGEKHADIIRALKRPEASHE